MSSQRVASNTDSHAGDQYSLDPVYVHARSETTVIVSLCVLFLAITLIVCGSLGYDKSPTEIAQVDATMGMPTWVFWGLLVPWVMVNLLTILFCFTWMAEDDLSDPDEEAMLQKMVELGPSSVDAYASHGEESK
jgi:hypothetical protein